MRVDKEPAYVLHTRAYQESSVIIDCLTLHYGRVGLVHKGARRIGKKAKLIQPFCELMVSWSGRGDLFTLTQSDVSNNIHFTNYKLTLCGLYLNELILSLTLRLSPSTELYQSYKAAIAHMADKRQAELSLRKFEIQLLKTIGYGLQLETDAEDHQPIDPERSYYYDYEQGPISRPPLRGTQRAIKGQTLLAMKRLEATDQSMFDRETLQEAKYVLRGVIDHQLQHRTVFTRRIMNYVGA